MSNNLHNFKSQTIVQYRTEQASSAILHTRLVIYSICCFNCSVMWLCTPGMYVYQFACYCKQTLSLEDTLGANPTPPLLLSSGPCSSHRPFKGGWGFTEIVDRWSLPPTSWKRATWKPIPWTNVGTVRTDIVENRGGAHQFCICSGSRSFLVKTI